MAVHMFSCSTFVFSLLLSTSLVALPEAAEASAAASFTVPLMKQDVPVLVRGRVVAHKTAYFGNVLVGLPTPQNFTVVFDTGSGHFFLPSAACTDEPCLNHRRYNREASQSALDINHDGGVVDAKDIVRDQVSISYGTGEIVGEFVKEVVCLGGFGSTPVASVASAEDINCARVRVITARGMTPEPFNNFMFDGVLGLGLSGLALDPEFHFLGQMTKGVGGLLPLFGVYLAPWRGNSEGELDPSEVRGEITFGGTDARRTSGPLSWVPVENPEHGHWRINIRSMRVGDQPISFCDDGSCSCILDTGTSLLGVPKASQQELLWKTARQVSDEDVARAAAVGGAGAAVDCRGVAGPPIIFDLGDGLEVRLEAEDYSRPAPSQVQLQGEEHTICRSSLLPIDMPTLGPKVFIWGEPILRRYYTAFDARMPKPRVGFSPVRHEGAASQAEPTEKTAASSTEARVFVV